MPTNDKLKQFFKSRLQDKQFQQDMKLLKSRFIEYQRHVDNTLERTYVHLNIDALGLQAHNEFNHIKQFVKKMSQSHILYAFGGQEDYVLFTLIDTSFHWVVQVDIQPLSHLETIDISDALNDHHLFVTNIHRSHAFGHASHQDVKNEVLLMLRGSQLNHHIRK